MSGGGYAQACMKGTRLLQFSRERVPAGKESTSRDDVAFEPRHAGTLLCSYSYLLVDAFDQNTHYAPFHFHPRRGFLEAEKCKYLPRD